MGENGPSPRRGHGGFQVAFVGAKGGVGTSVDVLLAANSAKRAGREVLLVDMTGDLGVILDTSPDLPGLADWMRADAQTRPAAVTTLCVDIAPGVQLLSRGSGELWFDDAMLHDLVLSLARADKATFIDAGTGEVGLARVAHPRIRRQLVMSCCYQALHRARQLLANDSDSPNRSIDDVIVQTDTNRALGLADIESSLGRDADAVIPFDRTISRWADAGLLLDRASKAIDKKVAGLFDLASAADAPEPEPDE